MKIEIIEICGSETTHYGLIPSAATFCCSLVFTNSPHMEIARRTVESLQCEIIAVFYCAL